MAPLPLPEASVDAILSTATFHWIPDHDRLFRHLAARRCGPAAGSSPSAAGTGNIASVRAAVADIGGDWPDPWTFATPEDTRRRLEAAGFEAIDTWLSDEPTPVAPGAPMREFLRTIVLGAHVDGLDARGAGRRSSTPSRRGSRNPRSTTCA